MDKLRIAYLAGTLGQGGAERQLFYFVKTLKLNGHDPYVLCLTKGDFWEKQIMDLKIPVIWVGKSNSRIGRLISIILKIIQLRPTIIHSQNFHTNLYAVVTGRFLRKKVIGSLRSNVFSEITDAGPLGKFCLSLPKMLVANSRSAIVNAVSLGKPRNQLFFLPNVVDEKIFTPGVEKVLKEKLHVVFVGTLWPPKRVDRIVRIAKKCLDQNLKIEFKIYGDGERKQSLINLAAQLGVQNKNLQFLGSIADTRIAYQNADALLLTSEHEGSPNVVLEAMACGLPVISTKVGDVEYLIKNNVNGYIVEPPDEEDKIVHHLEKLFSERTMMKAMGIINRKKIEEEASLQDLYKLLTKLYSL